MMPTGMIDEVHFPDRPDSVASTYSSVSTRTLYHPEKDPSVFRHFYPSHTPAETLKLPIFTQKAQVGFGGQTKYV